MSYTAYWKTMRQQTSISCGSDTRATQGYPCETDAEIERLLGLSMDLVPSEHIQSLQHSPRITPGFQQGLEKRLAQGKITQDVGQYYLKRLVNGDSSRIPGQNGRSSILRAVLLKDIAGLTMTGWRPLCRIGIGTNGAIVLWEKRRSGSSTLRLITKDTKTSSFFNDYCSEAHLTRRLNDLGCKNIINVVEWMYLPDPNMQSNDDLGYPAKGKHRIAYEFAEFGDLHMLCNWYRVRRLIFPERFIWHIFHAMANALCFCKRGTNVGKEVLRGWDSIVHGDIKQENILLASPNGGHYQEYPTIKLADFGLAYTTGGSVKAVHQYRSCWEYGTEGYIAPEILDHTASHEKRKRTRYELHDTHSDIYSLGVTIQKCLSLADPYSRESKSTDDGHRTTAFNVPPGTAPAKDATASSKNRNSRLIYSRALYDLVERCTALKPNHRPQTAELFLTTQTQLQLLQNPALNNLQDHVLFEKAGRYRYDCDTSFRAQYRAANLSAVPPHPPRKDTGVVYGGGLLTPESMSPVTADASSKDSNHRRTDAASPRASGAGRRSPRGLAGVFPLMKPPKAYRGVQWRRASDGDVQRVQGRHRVGLNALPRKLGLTRERDAGIAE